MVLYGTAALAICMLLGMLIGEFLGLLLGVEANIGGVGFAMILLIFATGWLRKHKLLPEPTERGLLFWSSMYIPIVVAMAAIQDVSGALSGGPMAVLGGIAATALGVAMVPVIAKIGKPVEPLPPLDEHGNEIVGPENTNEDVQSVKGRT